MKRTVLAVMAASVLMFSLAGLYTAVVARAFIAAHVDQTLLRTPRSSATRLGLRRRTAWLGRSFGGIGRASRPASR
jgi:hypothetical protein